MAHYNSLKVDEIVSALEELGGEADWLDVENRITAKRGGSYAPYLDKYNFIQTMNQLYQQHCQGYAKFIGPPLFEKAGKRPLRIRLLNSKYTQPNARSAETKSKTKSKAPKTKRKVISIK
jgi:hypothetical protein